MGEAAGNVSKQAYDVALWEFWPSLFPEHVGCLEASGSYAAVLSFMQQSGREKAAYAAARHVDRDRVDRWTHLYMPLDRGEKGRRK